MAEKRPRLDKKKAELLKFITILQMMGVDVVAFDGKDLKVKK